MKKRLRLFFVSCVGLMVASSLLVGCHKTDDPTPVVESMARNTIIIYMAGENTLADIVELDSAEIAAGVAKLPDSTRVVVYVDDTHSSRILVGSRNKPLRLAKTYGRNICSTDSTDMEQVFTDIYRDYPSRHYGLVFWSHASGWIPERQQAPRRRTFGIDNNRRNANSDLGTKMAVQTLARVLAHHPRPDYIFFDACFMQCIEFLLLTRGSSTSPQNILTLCLNTSESTSRNSTRNIWTAYNSTSGKNSLDATR